MNFNFSSTTKPPKYSLKNGNFNGDRILDDSLVYDYRLTEDFRDYAEIVYSAITERMSIRQIKNNLGSSLNDNWLADVLDYLVRNGQLRKIERIVDFYEPRG